ncbi:MAG TPA: ABC transporter permease [Vicinamibacterales bacterium]|nr:ABC transporter permease [Vicinamibacterales bacterium]
MVSALRLLAARLRRLARGRSPEADFDDDMEMHLGLLTERYVRQGMTPADAAMAARRQFGNTTLLHQDRREMQTFPAIEQAWRAVRYGARQLRLSPAFTAAAVLSLALGIGLTTAVFTMLDQLVLRLLPVAEPQRLVMIWSSGPNLGDNRGTRASSFPLCQDFQRQAVAFESVFCRYSTDAAITIDNSTEPVRAELVSGNYFHALGVGPALGRVFSADADDRVDKGHPVVVLSHRYWRDRLGGDPLVVGRKVLVNRQPMEVVGVVNPGFTGVDAAQAPQIWMSIRMKALMTPGEDGLNDRRYTFVQLFGRLKPGYTVDSARTSLQPLFHQFLEEEAKAPEISRASPFDRSRFLKRTVIVERAAAGYSDMRERYSTALTVLMGMAGLILLIACSNVASLLIARALARQREMAVRLSIGASRATLVGQLMVESLLLSFAGAALGLILSVGATRALLGMLPATDALLLLHAEPDVRVLLFSVCVSVATGLIFGLLPALQATRLDLCTALKASGGSTGSRRSVRLRKTLVVAQVSVSFLLLVGAGLFTKSLVNLKNVDTGMLDIGQLVTFRLDPAKGGYSVPQIRKFYGELQSELQATPGVSGAAYAWVPLLQGWTPSWHTQVEGHVAKDGEDREVSNNIVSPGYWRAMGVPLVEGREFDERDAIAPTEIGKIPTVALVSRSFAKRFFGTHSAVGRRFGVGEHAGELGVRIVGVVEDSLHAGPRTGVEPEISFSFLQANFPVEATFYVRTGTDATAFFPTVRRIVAKLDPAMPIYEMKTLQRQLDDTLSAERLIAALAMVFAALATGMAAIGLYGVMAFSVAQRTKEIGLRTALGASPGSVLWLVMREVLRLLVVGVLVGVPAAFLLSRYIASQLFGVIATDVWTTACAGVTLALVALAAGLLPARRASTISPLVALRSE